MLDSRAGGSLSAKVEEPREYLEVSWVASLLLLVPGWLVQRDDGPTFRLSRARSIVDVKYLSMCLSLTVAIKRGGERYECVP